MALRCRLPFPLRLQFLVGVLAPYLVIAPHHLARRLGNALLLDGLRRFLAGLLDLAGDFRAGLLAEAFARSVAVENLFALGIKFGLHLRIEGLERLVLVERPLAGAHAAGARRFPFFEHILFLTLF